MPNLTKAFFGGIRDGSEMVVNYGGVRWDVDLAGTTAATDDMVRCIQEARLGLIS